MTKYQHLLGLPERPLSDFEQKPREGFEYLKVPSPEEADENLRKCREMYPQLTLQEAQLLVIYRQTATVSSMVVNTSGGGRYKEYCRKIGVAW